jgi:hypothetical protein
MMLSLVSVITQPIYFHKRDIPFNYPILTPVKEDRSAPCHESAKARDPEAAWRWLL